VGIAPQLVGLVQAAVRERQQAEPLENYRSAVWAADEIYRALSLDPPPEVYWHTPNLGAKTTSLAALDIAFISGRGSLTTWDGERIRIPVIQPPVSGALIVPSYKLSSGSVVAKLRELLGDWPHHEGVISGAQDAIGILYVRHRCNPSEDHRQWSRLYLFPHEGEVPEAIRLDFAHGDEPPPQKVWDAIRNRAKAGRPFYRYIGATPKERRFWSWLRDDFPREKGKVVRGRLRLQSSLQDNRALSAADIARQFEVNASSPWKRAALHGEHVSAVGSPALDLERLEAMRADCVAGERYAIGLVRNEGREVFLPQSHARGELEAWGWPDTIDLGLVVADPSSGVRDPDKSDREQPRNPSGLALVSVARRVLLARFNGYVSAWELGQMARGLCNRCPRWLMVHETNGGWGDTYLRSFREAASVTEGTLYFEPDPITGKPATQAGWNQTASRRGTIISALQRAIVPGGLTIRSLAAIENLMEVRLNENERFDQGDGRGPHGEDMIVLGIAAHILERAKLPDGRRPADARPTDSRPEHLIYGPQRPPASIAVRQPW